MDKAMLINIHRILVIMRVNVSEKYIVKLGNELLTVLKNNLNANELCAKIKQEKFYVTICERFGNDFLICSNCKEQLSDDRTSQLKNMLCLALSDVIDLLNYNKYELAYAIIDAFHVLPELFLKSDYLNLEEYWNVYLKPIMSIWNTENSMTLKHLFLD